MSVEETGQTYQNLNNQGSFVKNPPSRNKKNKRHGPDSPVPILVVEDSPTQAEMLRRTLVKAGFSVDIARDGVEGLAMIRELKPALVISDIVMPEMGGVELCRRIRMDESLKETPFILLTSLSDPKDVLRGLECSADNFITKPWAEKSLFSIIEGLLTRRESPVTEGSQFDSVIVFDGQEYSIVADRHKILDFLLSTYALAIDKNHEMNKTQEELRNLNEHLEERIKQRTSVLLSEIAERKRAEEKIARQAQEVEAMTQQLWQAGKLAAIGELTASIAHEINNPLATVTLRLESLLAQAPAEDPKRQALEVMEQEVERMGNLVANLLQFSRRALHQISSINLAEEIEKTLGLVHFHLRNHHIEVVREFATNVPLILGDRQHLRQVFLNLISNASDAMPEGGTLTLRLGVADPAATRVFSEFIDTGAGIAPENLPRVMESFFTTKPEGQGTGLGLAICQRIVQEHNGTLDLASEVGQGTTVRLVLPVAAATNSAYLREA